MMWPLNLRPNSLCYKSASRWEMNFPLLVLQIHNSLWRWQFQIEWNNEKWLSFYQLRHNETLSTVTSTSEKRPLFITQTKVITSAPIYSSLKRAYDHWPITSSLSCSSHTFWTKTRYCISTHQIVSNSHRHISLPLQCSQSSYYQLHQGLESGLPIWLRVKNRNREIRV